MNIAPVRCAVEDQSQVAPARGAVRSVALHLGLPAELVDRVALAATELAQNLHLHAVQGELVAAAGRAENGTRTLDLFAVDRGPGVARFDRCLVDGYSTGGTMGTGLGAVRRLAAEFDAVSEPGLGTVVFARFAAEQMDAAGHDPEHFDLGVVGFPLAEDDPNGDAFAVVRRGNRLVVLVADGLGHGTLAAAASGAAVHALSGLADHEPGRLLGEVNRELVSTRGAAVSIASLDLDTARGGGELVSAGMGNVSVVVVGPDAETRRIATSHGTVGARAVASPSEQRTPFPGGGALIMHSDGLHSRWTLAGRPELMRHRAPVIAAALWREQQRGSDDSMVVVVKAARTL
jgi:anti-sigma regulatory factor (Ser/Thr protein kinase)